MSQSIITQKEFGDALVFVQYGYSQLCSETKSEQQYKDDWSTLIRPLQEHSPAAGQFAASLAAWHQCAVERKCWEQCGPQELLGWQMWRATLAKAAVHGGQLPQTPEAPPVFDDSEVTGLSRAQYAAVLLVLHRLGANDIKQVRFIEGLLELRIVTSCPLNEAAVLEKIKALFPVRTVRVQIQTDYEPPADIVWQGALRYGNADLLMCSFWKPLDNRDNPWILLLSKITPQRCQIREASDTVIDWMKLCPEFGRDFRQWIDCGLLGLYKNSNRKELTLARLVQFYELTRTPVRHLLFHMLLLKQQELLCIFTTRLVLMYLLPQQPALLAALAFPWNEFVDICHRMFDKLVDQINDSGWASLLLPCHADGTTTFEHLIQWLDHLTPYWLQLVTRQLEDTLPRTYASLLAADKMAQQEVKIVESTVATNGRRKRKRKVRRNKEKPEDLLLCVEAQREMQSIFYHRVQSGFFSLLYSSRNKVPPFTLRPYDGVPLSDLNEHGITKTHFVQLSACVDRLPDNCTENEALDLLLAFGASERGLQCLKQLKIDHESQQGKKTIVNGLVNVAIRFPYTNALAHTLALLFTRHQTFRVYRLPLHYLVGQVEAIRGKWGLSPTDSIPIDACWLKVCRVCDNVFSLINTEKIKWRASDTFGYKYVCANLATGDEYCSRGKVIAHTHVRDTELSKIWILGHAIVWRGRIYMLCPGVNCGIPFVFSEQSFYLANRGYLCSACSVQSATTIPVNGRKKKKSRKLKLTDLVPAVPLR